MAKCKLCGKSVTIAPVYHPSCAGEILEQVVGELCDQYCYFAHELKSQVILEEEYCSCCPLIKLLTQGEMNYD